MKDALTPESAIRYAHTIARMVMHGQGADAAQVVLLIGSNEYERGKADADDSAVVGALAGITAGH